MRREGGEGRRRGGSEGGELVGGEEKGRKEDKEESVSAHYILGSGSPHGSLACGWSVLCVLILLCNNYYNSYTTVRYS